MLMSGSVSVVSDWMVAGENAKVVSKAVRKWRCFMVGRKDCDLFCIG